MSKRVQLEKGTLVRLLKLGNKKISEKFVAKIVEFVEEGENGNDKYLLSFSHLDTDWTVVATLDDFVLIDDFVIQEFVPPIPLELDETYGNDSYFAMNLMISRIHSKIYKNSLEHYINYQEFVTDEHYQKLEDNYNKYSKIILDCFKKDLKTAFSNVFSGEAGNILFNNIYEFVFDEFFDGSFEVSNYNLEKFVKTFAKTFYIFNGLKVVKNVE